MYKRATSYNSDIRLRLAPPKFPIGKLRMSANRCPKLPALIKLEFKSL